MRLQQPGLHMLQCLPLPPGDDGSETAIENSSPFAVSNSLILPAFSGKIYRGQTFRSYVCGLNSLKCPIRFQMAAKIQWNSGRDEAELHDVRRKNLPHKQKEQHVKGPLVDLQEQGVYDMVVEHKIVSSGEHTLRVFVTFLNEKEEWDTFRKGYKFKAENPITYEEDVREVGDFIFVGMKITNEISDGMFLKTARLNPAPGFELLSSSAEDDRERKEETVRVFQPCLPLHLAPKDTVHILYRLRKNIDVPSDMKNGLGRVYLEWASSMGEKGDMATEPVKFPAFLEQNTYFDVTLKGEPPLLRLKQPASLSCVINNKGDKEANIQLRILQDDSADSGVFIQEVTSRNIGIINGHSSKEIELQVMPLCAGVHTIDGISIVNADTNQELFNGKLCDILIQS